MLSLELGNAYALPNLREYFVQNLHVPGGFYVTVKYPVI